MVQTFSVLNCGLTRAHEVEMGANGCWAWEAGGSGSTPGSVWLRAQPRQSPRLFSETASFSQRVVLKK